MQRLNVRLISLLLVTVAFIGLLVAVIIPMLRQPETADFKRLDLQRQAVDTSMNVYGPLLADYSGEYANAFNEDRSSDEQTALKERHAELLKMERTANIERLDTMRSSVALKKSEIKSAFQEYEAAYRAVVEYYDRYAANLAIMTETVAGKCDLNSDLNVASASIAEDYTKAADACLSALSSAKKTSDEPTKKMLSSVEKLVKTRRDAFSKAIGKEGLEGSATKISALASLLSVNSELKPIQSQYQADVKAEYTELVNRANDSNNALKKALQPFVKTEGSKV